MDILNDYYPLHPPKPESVTDTDETLEDYEHIKKLDDINNRKKRKKIFTLDDFCIKYNDEMWYIWNIIHDYSISGLLDRLTFSEFCEVCYKNSSKH